MKKLILISLAVVAALGLAVVVGYRVAQRDTATALEAAYVSGKTQGTVDGVEVGKQELRDRSGKWFCVNAETKRDGNQILFCLSNSAARDQMCQHAMLSAEQDPTNTVVHGCPDVLVVSETPSETPVSEPPPPPALPTL